MSPEEGSEADEGSVVVEVGSASMNASLGSMGGRLFGSGFNSI